MEVYCFLLIVVVVSGVNYLEAGSIDDKFHTIICSSNVSSETNISSKFPSNCWHILKKCFLGTTCMHNAMFNIATICRVSR